MKKPKKQYAVALKFNDGYKLFLRQNEFPGIEATHRFVLDNGDAAATIKAFEKKYGVKIVELKVNSHKEYIIDETTHTWRKSELIVWLRRTARKLRRLPSKRDILAESGPTVIVFYKKFGSLADAYRAAGLLKGE
ncbi:MAG: homing endonuclease associated repeat-containing protein [Elusimicrobiales bacterium]